MPSRPYRLTMRKGPMPGKVYDLAKSMLTLGREVKNDIVINDAEVSRLHLRLNETERGYQVEDQASTNGTFINGQRVNAPMLLRSGDILGLGETIELVYAEVRDVNATVMTGTSQPAPSMPVSEPPQPEPVMAQPVAPFPPPSYTPPPATAPFTSSTAPEEKKPQQRWIWAVGITCGCLTLLGCLGGAAVLFYFFANSGRF